MGKVVRQRCAAVLCAGVLVGASLGAQGAVTVYEEGAKSLSFGGRIQVQYNHVDSDTDGAENVDDLLLRRLRFYVEGTLTEGISGKLGVDLGSTGNDAEVKNAYIKYSRWGFANIVVGNHYVPFAREILTSDSRQQLVEKQFVGDHNFGVPDRQLGLSLQGQSKKLLGYAIGAYKAGIDGSTARVDFESPASQPEDDDYFYVGNLVAARLDYTPFGPFQYAQGAFGSDLKLGIGINAYTWHNDEDEPDPDGDGVGDEYQDITGLGIDAALRVGYFSADAAFQTYQADTIDDRITAGLVEDGEADFSTWLVKAGYMVIPNTLETVVGWSVLDADAYDDQDTRLSFGLNWYLNQHADKIQLTYEIGSDVIASDGNTAVGDDQNVIYMQFQHIL